MGLFGKRKTKEYYSVDKVVEALEEEQSGMGKESEKEENHTGNWKEEKVSDVSTAPDRKEKRAEYVKMLQTSTRPEEESFSSEEASVISEQLVIEGNLVCHSDLIIKGKVKGDIICKGSLKVSGIVLGNVLEARTIELDGGRICGNIVAKGDFISTAQSISMGEVKCRNMNLDGRHKGDIFADDKAVMGEKSVLLGSLTCDGFFVEHGSYIDGRIIPKSAITVRELFQNVEEAEDM